MIVVSVSDVEELNSKLASDRAKVREEGLKTLQGYLDWTGDVSLWTLLDQETAALDQSRIRSSSWPGVLQALCVCIENEVAASKKKKPKLLLAKALRSFILKADDSSRAGQSLNLLRKMKRLYQHVVEIVDRVPSFVPDYNNVLCQLLPIFEYRTRMSKKVYADLLHFYLQKAKDISQNSAVEASLTREEAFRNISTLLCLLQHPPGDLPDILLRDISQDFIKIFSNLRDEGRIAKKLLAALNSFITGNGLNIGDVAVSIHSSLKPFVVRLWLTTRDRELKDGLVIYARAQLNLRYILFRDDSEEISVLLDLVEKDLDQTGVSMASLHRLDAGREDKAGFVTKAIRSLFELAAVVLFEASRSVGIRSSNASKRRRKADVTTVIKERVMEGKYMWCGALCLLIRRFGSRLPVAVILGWVEGLASSLDRIILEGINSRNFEGPIWTLRSVQELAMLWGRTFQIAGKGGGGLSFPQIMKAESIWKSIWDALLHWLPLLSNVQVMVEEIFRLLGTLAAQSSIPMGSIPQEFWDLHRFTESPSGNLLYFITSFFVAPNCSMLNSDVEARKKLIDWCLSSLDAQDVHRTRYVFGEQLSPKLLTAAVVALAFGVILGTSSTHEHLTWLRKELSWPSREREPYLEPDESEQAQEVELAALDRSDRFLVLEELVSPPQEIKHSSVSLNQLPRSSTDALLQRVADNLLKNVVMAADATQSFTLSQLLHLSTILANCIDGVEHATERWAQPPSDWCSKGAIWEGLANILERNIMILDDISRALSSEQSLASPAAGPTSIISNKNATLQPFTQSTLECLQEFGNSVKSCAFVTSGGVLDCSSTASEPLLMKLLKAARKAYLSAGEAAAIGADEFGQMGRGITNAGDDSRISQNSVVGTRIIDSDLDVEMEPGILGGVSVGDAGNGTSSGMSTISTYSSQDKGTADLRCSLLQIMGVIGKVMPDATCSALSDLLIDEKDPKVQGDILLSLCRTISVTTTEYLTVVVSKMRGALSECKQSESMRYQVVTAMDVLFSSLLYSRGVSQKLGEYDGAPKELENLSLEISELIGKIVDMGLQLWPTRVKLVGAISQFIVLDPSAAQVLTDKFLVLLHDPEYQVRLCMSRKVAVLFETWDGHDELLQDVCGSFGVKMAKLTTDRRFSVGDALQGQQEVIMAETALLSLGEIAIASEQVENEVVFIICAHAAVNPLSRSLVCAVLNRMGKQLKYPNRLKYMQQILGQLLTHWVVSNVNVSTLLEVREVLVETAMERDFLLQCCPWLLPWLIYYERADQIQWLATALSLSTPALVKHYFQSIFAAILPLHLESDETFQRRAAKALQVSMLELAGISEDERDALIQKRMVQIVGSLLKLCSAREKPQLPYFPKERIVSTIKTVVDGFLDSNQVFREGNVIDKMQVFRPDRVFKLLLEIHVGLFTALHPRHRRNLLTSIAAILHVLDVRAAVPSTCRYLILIILQSIESDELREQCCGLLSDVVGKLDCSGLESSNQILGEQLQLIVSKLVSCCLSTYGGGEAFKSTSNKLMRVGSDCQQSSSAFSLLHRLTVERYPSLHEYVKDLDPFPEFPCFEPMLALHNESRASRTLAEDLVQFVRRVPNFLSKVRSSSLENLQDQLRTRRKELFSPSRGHREHSTKSWRCSGIVVDAVWKFVKLCDKHDDLDMKNLAGEFLAAVGVGDPHAVVFHLPDEDNEEHSTWFADTANGKTIVGSVNAISIDPEWGLSEDLLRCIIIQLRSYLIDSDVHVIQLASYTLKGLLSTDKGKRVFLSLNEKEKTYLEMYSRGVNSKLVTDMVDAAKQKSGESAIPLDDPSIWQTSGISYDVWVCTLTHSLLAHSQDTILRLCQDILSVKAPLAELVFPHVFGSLAGEYNSDSELCVLISKQVEEHLFNDANHSTRSLQLFLNTLNSLRQCFIHSGMKGPSAPSKRRDPPKIEKAVMSGGSRTRKGHSSVVAEIAASSEDHMDDYHTSWNKVYWLQIDYLSTARAAQQCAAYFTSVLYVEHWCEESFGSVTLGPPDFSSDDELPSHLELLLRAYTRINEPDGVYGVVRTHKVTSQLLRYEHEGNWSKALENYDLLLRTAQPAKSRGQFTKMNDMFTQQSPSSKGRVDPNWQLHKGLMRTLQQKGCSQILEVYRCGVSQQEPGLRLDAEFKEMQFEAAWRTGNWEDVNLKGSGSKQTSFNPVAGTKGLCYHEHLHSSLKSLIEGDAEMYSSALKMARQEIVTHIARTSIESTQNVNPLIVKLQILDCVSQAWEMRWSVRHPSQHSVINNRPSEIPRSTVNGPLVASREQIASFEASWQDNLKQMQTHYEFAEPYIAVHKVLLELLDLRDHIPQHLLHLGSFSRKAGRLNHAGAAIHELKSICSETVRTSDAHVHYNLQPVSSRHCVAGRVEEAKILWAEGHQEMAVNLAKYVLQLKSDGTDSALLLCLTGKWLAETRSSSSRVILDSYLKQAVELSKSGTDQMRTIRRCRTHFRLAHYADALYRSHQERLTSKEWQSALRLRNHKAKEFEALKERLQVLRADPREDPIKVKEYSMKLVELSKQLTIDAEEAQHLQNDKDHFLSIALENYCSCLCISNKYDLRVVFRLISLWFNLSTNAHVMEAMFETVEKVQSYKFLPLVYQIASRLGSFKEGSKELQGPNTFQKALAFLLRKMATEHPYHSLYQLFALANGDRVKEKQRGKNVFVVDVEKKRAAEELLGSLAARHSNVLSQIKKMIEIYIRLAEMETTPKDANKKLLPIPREIRNIRQLELVPVVTASVPVDHSCQYQPDSFPHFKGFSEGIKIMNGVNAPKYMECLGSDGNKYRQLAKSGNDDLRQDAVMEQLFGLVNELLQAHPDTHKRNLSIRTYKVVPFTPSAGVLEWVDGTIPLAEYLLGSNRLGGAHARYGGDDWSFFTCREHMCTVKDKRTGFETVLKNFRPVMHNFFLENFGKAEDWFEKRLAYTRSVATSSMVGYIVGLGDRHSMNILLDQATAEVVHIDLGVAFEQGLMLKTPERIPFRLTGDVVDGMGVTGVEGVFRRCCEATLAVLRTNKEALLTIVEVFIYDPLYNWALSPLKALQRQQELEDLDDSSSNTNTIVEMEGNKDAARALFRVKQKLDGYEEGEMRSLQGQVQQLIQDAQDPERLSQLFPGWGAWV